VSDADIGLDGFEFGLADPEHDRLVFMRRDDRDVHPRPSGPQPVAHEG
jgi:hypothetical protein